VKIYHINDNEIYGTWTLGFVGNIEGYQVMNVTIKDSKLVDFSGFLIWTNSESITLVNKNGESVVFWENKHFNSLYALNDGSAVYVSTSF